MAIQIPLSFAFHDNQDFDAYHSGENTEIVEALKASAKNTGEKFIFLWGKPGLGKSHLLQACCKFAGEAEQNAFYLPFRKLANYGPDVLDGIDNYPLVCIDDIDTIIGNADWETKLFHFFNRHRDRNHRLVISASKSAKDLPLQLPDLATRMYWGLSLRLRPPNDTDKLSALRLRAKMLGFELPANVGRYLLNRYPRDLPSLWDLLENLDSATLAAQRRLTIPFLKAYLAKGGQ